MSNPLPAVSIRAANLADAASLSALCVQLGYAASPQQVEQRLEPVLPHPDHAVYVAESEAGSVLGWVHAHVCLLLTSPTWIEILGLVVDESFRSSGIGGRLLQQVEAWASERNCRSILVRSNVRRTEAHRFYEKQGYALIKQSMVFRKTF